MRPRLLSTAQRAIYRLLGPVFELPGDPASSPRRGALFGVNWVAGVLRVTFGGSLAGKVSSSCRSNSSLSSRFSRSSGVSFLVGIGTSVLLHAVFFDLPHGASTACIPGSDRELGGGLPQIYLRQTSGQSTCSAVGPSPLCGRDASVAWQDSIDPADEESELRHVVPQKLGGSRVRHLAVVADKTGRKLDVG